MATIYDRVNGVPLHDYVAHLPAVVAECNLKAREGAEIAKALLAAHKKSGKTNIGDVEIGITDSYIYLNSPKGIAHIIEYGRAGYVTKKPQPIGGMVVPAGTRIGPMEGLHILRRTYEAM